MKIDILATAMMNSRLSLAQWLCMNGAEISVEAYSFPRGKELQEILCSLKEDIIKVIKNNIHDKVGNIRYLKEEYGFGLQDAKDVVNFLYYNSTDYHEMYLDLKDKYKEQQEEIAALKQHITELQYRVFEQES